MTLVLARKQEAGAPRSDGIIRPGMKDTSSPEAELVSRVVATPAFTRSVLLTRFLLYVCDRKFSGHDDEITEYQIGVHALGRPAFYNPREDNIVRNYARILRRRLDEYFAGEGRSEPLRIVIPVGHYVPVFEPNHHAASTSSAADPHPADSTPVLISEPVQAMAGKSVWHRLRVVAIPLTVLLAAATALPLYHLIHLHRAPSNHSDDVFWKQVFDRNRATYLVPGDSGLAMMQDITGKEIPLSDYIAGNLDEKFHNFNLAAAHRGTKYGFDRISNLTSKADLSIATGIERLAQLYGGQLRICYSRYMNMDNFKDSNVILVGGPRANPWVELFEPESNFHMIFPMHGDSIDFDKPSFINEHPQSGEQASYASQVDGTPPRTYALISYLPETNDSGRVLLLEGQGMAGTQAAGDFLMDPHAMEPILNKAQSHDGSIGPFEVLIEARIVGANEAQSRIVAERFGVTKNSD